MLTILLSTDEIFLCRKLDTLFSHILDLPIFRTGILEIHIADINDNAPFFNRPVFTGGNFFTLFFTFLLAFIIILIFLGTYQ